MHSVYLYRQEWLYRIVECAKEYKTGIHMHLHETIKEIDDFTALNQGMRPTEFLEEIGAFDVKTVAAHCTHLSDSDIEILKKHDVNVAINMTSNLKLGSGIPPLTRLIASGVNVTLGTDGCASNNNLNMFEEIHLAALLYKGLYQDPTLIKASQVVDMATKNGASALCDVPCGTIAKGSMANMIIVDLSAIHLTPVNDINALICYSMQGSDVDTVIIDGNIVMKQKKFTLIDEEKIMHEVKKIKLHK
jgi:5-methylthioadenosine/S-adenosylhomocysteine deaminase